MWPLIAAAAIGAAGNMAGGAMQGRNSRSAAREANRINQDMQLREMQYNAGQANADRQYNHDEANYARGWEQEMTSASQAFNAGQAQESRNFEERMSNTQYQRATQDMMAAGLNPMLGYSQGGAGNVGGATASSNAPSTSAPSSSGARISGGSAAQQPQFTNWLGQGISSAMQTYTSILGAEQMEASTAESKARTLSQVAEAQRIASQTNLNSAQTSQMNQAIKDALFAWDNGYRQRDIRNLSDNVARDVNIKDETWQQNVERTKQERQATKLQALEFPRATGEAQFHKMLNDNIQGGANSASSIKDIFLKGLSGAHHWMPKDRTVIHRRGN